MVTTYAAINSPVRRMDRVHPGARSFAPALHCSGLVAYKEGHLCSACEATVETSLATRRTAIAAAEFSDRRGPAT